MTTRWFRVIFLSVLVYFGQVSPLFHLHHFHDDGITEFEFSSHSVDIDVDHSSDHHHDGDRPHSNDHQHNFDTPVDWHVVRTQSPRTLAFDDQRFVSSVPTIQARDSKSSNYVFEDPFFIDEYYVASLVIRGPPLLG